MLEHVQIAIGIRNEIKLIDCDDKTRSVTLMLRNDEHKKEWSIALSAIQKLQEKDTDTAKKVAASKANEPFQVEADEEKDNGGIQINSTKISTKDDVEKAASLRKKRVGVINELKA